jgi:holo-[acyl-carrier protein] synthase
MNALLLRSGVDLVDVRRVAEMTEAGGEDYINTVWTAAEQNYSAGRIERLAGRWAVKEAAMKALGTGFPTLGFLDIEVLGSLGKAPQLHLHGPAAASASELGLTTWSASISYERDLAIGLVVATGTMTP